MKFSGFILLLAFLASTSAAQILVFNFNNETSDTTILTASTLDGNLSAGLFSVSDGGFTDTTSTTGGASTNTVRDAGSWGGTSTADGKYFSFTFDPNPDYAVGTTSLSFDYRVTDTTGASSYIVQIGGTQVSGSLTADGSYHNASSSITLSGITESTEVRIYGLNGSNGGSVSFNIDNVTLNGSVSAVPEPSSFAAFLGLGALGFVATRRRGKKSNPAEVA